MQRPEIDPELLRYAKRFLSGSQLHWLVPDAPVRNYGTVTTIVLHRDKQYQTELVISHPKANEWPGEHSHPNVDSIECEIFNCKGLTRNGQPVDKPDVIYGGRYLVHLAPTDLHGSKYSDNGISLLSFQHWLNGVEPSSVGMDWSGAPVTDEHSNLLVEAK